MMKFVIVIYSIAIIAFVAQLANAIPAIIGGKDNSCNCVCGVRGRENRIVGGDASKPHDYPWLAGLYRQGKLYCGASVISENYLLTAAHCVEPFEASEIRVYLGGHNITKDYVQRRRVKTIIAHESFGLFSFNNDIALLRMDRPIKFGPKIQPICLPDGTKDDFAGEVAVVAGWGRLGENKPPSDILHHVKVPIWTQDQCMDAGYGSQRISNNMMCGGYHDGERDACQGDSGGPMHLAGPTGSMEIIGVVSWGRGCARPNLPGIYTKVVNYLPWIKSSLDADECLCAPRIGQRSS